jgi:TPR repeat protein
MNDKVIFAWHGSAIRKVRLAKDPAFAAGQVRKAALSGDAAAQLSWGLMLLDGHGTPRDLPAAFNWIQLSARAGTRDAVNMLGRCHELGWGTDVNLAIAAHCYRAAAELKHPWAQFNLACLMLREDGVPGELTEALTLLARSARQGNIKSMNMLGRCCEEGWRGTPKPAAARRWYLRAARGGCFRGAFHTARHLIADGEIDQAVQWLRQSIASAPADFCEELANVFATHPADRLRALSDLARAQATRAARQAPAGEPRAQTAPSEPALSRQRPRRIRPGRRAVRRFAAAVGIVRQ